LGDGLLDFRVGYAWEKFGQVPGNLGRQSLGLFNGNGDWVILFFVVAIKILP
jgi:hypothetical protein